MMAKIITSKKRIQLEPIQCQWGMLCSSSSIDQERNNVSLFHIIDQLNIPEVAFTQQKKEKKPIGIPYPLELVVCWRRTLDVKISDEELSTDCKIKFIDSRGEMIQEILSQITIPKGMKLLRLRFQMKGFMITEPGQYCFQIEIKLPLKDEFKNVLEIPYLVAVQNEKIKAN
jgi:hypothetical protein